VDFRPLTRLSPLNNLSVTNPFLVSFYIIDQLVVVIDSINGNRLTLPRSRAVVVQKWISGRLRNFRRDTFHAHSRSWHFLCGFGFLFSHWYFNTIYASPSNLRSAKGRICTFLCMTLFTLIPDLGTFCADLDFHFRIGISIPFMLHLSIYVRPKAVFALFCA
jgi:hypothetical protein